MNVLLVKVQNDSQATKSSGIFWINFKGAPIGILGPSEIRSLFKHTTQIKDCVQIIRVFFELPSKQQFTFFPINNRSKRLQVDHPLLQR
mmetsp:Transcript_9466/g.21659  ORF Transcript_9466/g.21659 Transcript_9466/m.21659 type:complete len:89 (+) Transcript_9466:482-748(+)